MSNLRQLEESARVVSETGAAQPRKRKAGKKRVERRLRGGKHTLRTNDDKARKTRKNAACYRPTGTEVYGDDGNPIHDTRFSVQVATSYVLSRMGSTHADADDVIQSAAVVWFTRTNRGETCTTKEATFHALQRYWQEQRRDKQRRDALEHELGNRTGYGGTGKRIYVGMPLSAATSDLSPSLRALAHMLASGQTQANCAVELGLSPMAVSRMVAKLVATIGNDYFTEETSTIPHVEPSPAPPMVFVRAPLDNDDNGEQAEGIVDTFGSLVRPQRYALHTVSVDTVCVKCEWQRYVNSLPWYDRYGMVCDGLGV